MNIKLVASESGSNQGSAKGVIHYLEKENKGKSLAEKTWFFSHERDWVGTREAIEALDHNKKKLSKRDAKFYMVTISPSQEELAFIGNDPEKLRGYTREVMELYAQNFGKGLRGEDLLYFAKIEQHRYYRGTDPEVQAGLVKQKTPKPGLQTHIHVIVSRKDRANQRKLSPLSHHRKTTKGPVKGGFDRSQFYLAAEQCFDRLFGYVRGQEESFVVLNERKNGRKIEPQLVQPAPHAARSQSSLRGIKQLNQALRREDPTHRQQLERKRRRQREEGLEM